MEAAEKERLKAAIQNRGARIWGDLKGTQKFEVMWELYGSTLHPVKEWRFHPDRAWAFDYAWPDQKLAVEVLGFGFGHQAKGQLVKDCEKTRGALLLGWVVVPFTTGCISSIGRSRDAVEYLMTLQEIRNHGEGISSVST